MMTQSVASIASANRQKLESKIFRLSKYSIKVTITSNWNIRFQVFGLGTRYKYRRNYYSRGRAFGRRS